MVFTETTRQSEEYLTPPVWKLIIFRYNFEKSMKNEQFSCWNVVAFDRKNYLVDVERGRKFEESNRGQNPFLFADSMAFFQTHFPQRIEDANIPRCEHLTLQEWQQIVRKYFIFVIQNI